MFECASYSKKKRSKMILCLFRCGYEPNYVRLPLYLYTMIFEYLCVLNFGKVYKKKLYSTQKGSTYTVRTHYCKRLLKKNVDD